MASRKLRGGPDHGGRTMSLNILHLRCLWDKQMEIFSKEPKARGWRAVLADAGM